MQVRETHTAYIHTYMSVQVLKLYCVCGGRGADYQQCLVLLILGATTAAGKTDWALKQHICILMATMLIHITMEFI